jgi:DNA replication protein DnaC
MTEIKRAGSILSHPIELPEQDIECPKHGIFRGKPIKGYWAFGFEDHITNPECPKCAAEREEKEKWEEEDRRKRLEIARLKDMGIRKRYYNTFFETFSAYNDELKKHLKIAMNYAKKPDGKLVMLGENGTGKTHLAISIIRKTGGVIYTAFEIGVRLRQSYGGETQEWKILKELCDTEMLIIDEIGRSKGSDWDLNWLSHVINKRHECMKPTILISNRHLQADCPAGGCPKCLENFFDNDVISRIIEDGIVMKFTGDDYRKTKGEQFREQKRNENNA